MRVIFMGKNKPVVVRGFETIIAKKIEVVACVTTPDVPDAANPGLAGVAQSRRIPVLDAEDLLPAVVDTGSMLRKELALDTVDLVLSFVYWRRIPKALIDLPRLGCINFHPAPLPEYRGWGVYNFGVYEQVDSWGVSAHFVDESFDTGDLILVRRFSVDPDTETAISLSRKSQPHLVALLNEVMDMVSRDGSLPREPQGPGRYFSREVTEQLRRIQPDDTPDQIARKIRAFWYPPNPGAVVEVHGRTYTVVDDALLRQVAGLYPNDYSQDPYAP